MRKNLPVGVESVRGATRDRRVCRWFLELYSDYRDDRLEAEPRAAVIAHMGECSSCRRYDRVIRTGVAVLRDSFEGDADRRFGGAARHFDRDRMKDDGGVRRAPRGSDPSLSGIALAAIVVAIALNGAASWGARLAPTPAQTETGVAVAAPAAAGPTAAPVSFPLPPSLRVLPTDPEGDGSETEVDPPGVRIPGTVPADRD